MKNSHSESYAAAGVDVTAGYAPVNRIKPLVESTYIPGIIGTLGGFGGLFAANLEGIQKPVLVSGTDGVGTKLKLAFVLDKHDTVGIDCVAMCVNDIVCSGAAPLFFLDYLAVGKNVPERVESIVSGVVEGCRYGIHTADKSVRRSECNTAHGIIPQMLCYLNDQFSALF